jgi:hypothetical protein
LVSHSDLILVDAVSKCLIKKEIRRNDDGRDMLPFSALHAYNAKCHGEISAILPKLVEAASNQSSEVSRNAMEILDMVGLSEQTASDKSKNDADRASMAKAIHTLVAEVKRSEELFITRPFISS